MINRLNIPTTQVISYISQANLGSERQRELIRYATKVGEEKLGKQFLGE